MTIESIRERAQTPAVNVEHLAIELRRRNNPKLVEWALAAQESRDVWMAEARDLLSALGAMAESEPPVQGGATEEQIEAATWALIELDTDTTDRGVSGEHYRERRAEVERIAPIFSVSASADPAVERHDAGERQAESEDHAGRTSTASALGARADDRDENDRAAGWSSEDRQDALAEARRRWSRPQSEWTKRHFDGCINGFALGAEWQKAKMPALAAPIEVDREQLRKIIAPVLFNSMNYPEPGRMAGRSFSKLQDALIDALAAEESGS